MNILKFGEEDDDDLFANDQSEQFSIEQQTEQLLNEVFNQKYQPIYNPDSTKKKEEELLKKKRQTNEVYKEKIKHKKDIFYRIYQNFDNQSVPPSFNEFLIKSQERVDKRNFWLHRERQKKAAEEVKVLRDKPEILRGSRQTLVPIYQRCIDLQKEKEKQLQSKRNAKFCKEVVEAESHTYHPATNGPRQQRTFQQYISQKEAWQKQKQEQIQKKRFVKQAKKLSQCTFTPNLVAKYNKSNSRIIPGEKVEDRLLRTLDRSLQKQAKTRSGKVEQ